MRLTSCTGCASPPPDGIPVQSFTNPGAKTPLHSVTHPLMATPDAPTPTPELTPPADVCPAGDALPSLTTTLSSAEIREKLDVAARKGRMPGLELQSQAGIFEIREFGQPFESTLTATAAAGVDGFQTIEFQSKIRPMFPTVFAVMLVVSIWPGIYLVDSMVRHYFSWYDIPTWWWYLPLTVPTSPWAFWSAVKKSRASASVEARRLIERVATELKAKIVEQTSQSEANEPVIARDSA